MGMYGLTYSLYHHRGNYVVHFIGCIASNTKCEYSYTDIVIVMENKVNRYWPLAGYVAFEWAVGNIYGSLQIRLP